MCGVGEGIGGGEEEEGKVEWKRSQKGRKERGTTEQKQSINNQWLP